MIASEIERRTIYMCFLQFLILNRELTRFNTTSNRCRWWSGLIRGQKDLYDEEEPELEDCDVAEMLLTYLFGKLHLWSAETLLFIKGRSTLSTKLRLSMFIVQGGRFWCILWSHVWSYTTFNYSLIYECSTVLLKYQSTETIRVFKLQDDWAHPVHKSCAE